MPGNETMKVSYCRQYHCKRAEARRAHEPHCRRRARRGVQSRDPAYHKICDDPWLMEKIIDSGQTALKSINIYLLIAKL